MSTANTKASHGPAGSARSVPVKRSYDLSRHSASVLDGYTWTIDRRIPASNNPQCYSGHRFTQDCSLLTAASIAACQQACLHLAIPDRRQMER
jgi:hypothetical protein